MAAGYSIWGVKVRTLLFVTGLGIAVGVLSGLALFGMSRTSAATCTDNDIIKCGFSTSSDFISKVRANDNGVDSTHDLQAIYAHYGLSAGDYDNFADNAVQGEAMRDGQITVNGKVVATGGMSIGRIQSYQGSGPFTVTIGGHNYYGNVNSQAFAPGVNEIPVYVLLGSDGSFKFAVMPACGNPEFGTPVPQPAPKPKPVPRPTPQPTPMPIPYPQRVSPFCSGLTPTRSIDDSAMYTFTATAVLNGTQLVSADIYFGDGNVQNGIPPNGDGRIAETTYTYAASGTYTAFAILHFAVPGQEVVQASPCSVLVSPVVPVPVSTPPLTVTPPVVTTASTPPPRQPLPNTGAGDVIGLFGLVTVLGYLGYWGFLRHKVPRG